MNKFKIISIYLLQRWILWFEKNLFKTNYSTERSLKKENYDLFEDALAKFLGLGLFFLIIFSLLLPGLGII